MSEEFPDRPQCGIIFGPESSGLTNSDLDSVDSIVQIATNPNFGSLALPQAVNICCHHYFMAATHDRNQRSLGGTSSDRITPDRYGDEVREADSAETSSEAAMHIHDGSVLATKGEVMNLMGRLEAALTQAEFKQGGETAGSYFEQKLKNLLGRSRITTAELSLLHGVLSALVKGKKLPRNQREKMRPTESDCSENRS
jgi:tRNA/rRNA methyltransferase